VDEGTRGERLAAWLEGLGLTEHLAEAGLPVLDRDADGRAVWTDPGTRRPMTEEQLAEVERLLRQDGSEPEHAVPVSLVQLARRARVREALLASPWHTYETLAQVRGGSVDATRFAIHKAASEHRLLIVAGEHGRTMVPAFQLDAAGEVRGELVAVLEPLLTSRLDAWAIWGWLTQPAALLGGEVPERVVADPEEAAVVLHAAVRLAERSGA
jgi:hypothetical protein